MTLKELYEDAVPHGVQKVDVFPHTIPTGPYEQDILFSLVKGQKRTDSLLSLYGDIEVIDWKPADRGTVIAEVCWKG